MIHHKAFFVVLLLFTQSRLKIGPDTTHEVSRVGVTLKAELINDKVFLFEDVFVSNCNL